jgi:hypothetical protein
MFYPQSYGGILKNKELYHRSSLLFNRHRYCMETEFIVRDKQNKFMWVLIVP